MYQRCEKFWNPEESQEQVIKSLEAQLQLSNQIVLQQVYSSLTYPIGFDTNLLQAGADVLLADLGFKKVLDFFSSANKDSAPCATKQQCCRQIVLQIIMGFVLYQIVAVFLQDFGVVCFQID